MLGSIFAFQYHRVIDDDHRCFGDRAAPRARFDRRSLEVAKSVGGTAGAHLADAAQHAFVSSMRITFGVAAVVVLFAALVAARFLPARAADPHADVTADEVVDSLVVGVETAT